MFVGQEFVNIGWSLKGGLPYQPWARDLVRERMEQYGKDDPGSHCLPVGVVKTHTTPLLRKIIQIPGLVVILSERDASYRQIFTDGRPLPADISLPSANGFSTGKWEGDTLVVQTMGFRDGNAHRDQEMPGTDAVSGIVVFGGVQHADDVDTHPYLKAERELLHDATERGVPVLGICLGGQLLALAKGASLRPAPVREFGFTPIEPTPEGKVDPVMSVWEPGDRVFHWHEDTFEMPDGATAGDVWKGLDKLKL